MCISETVFYTHGNMTYTPIHENQNFKVVRK